MSGRRQRRAGTVLITKENGIDRVPCGGKFVCFPNFHHRPDLSAEAHHTAFCRKRKFGGGVANGFIGSFERQSHALTILFPVELPDIRKGS